ncbi:ATP synthase F1 subunit gamma [Gordonibacter pamelaeae]|uniref:ATP synthase F1 subunit gamma n=1 Tax=Gordonibacter pamelaeae TaxID=471189 RepID=UPI0012B0D74A|nr:ATP synthase F1 subunit gamma [Gordonibacter pamelaeae]MBS6976184.1 ATP synthase F1 subunit gamma [Eggerthellaceae bacterium]MCQ4846424.1 ATP synthase F1 subunit gamma [Gordonibacter pamelaeae]MCQ4849909.1 ATP synthase F1 subunit gamma [Gordonibacter pamelaeae]MSA62045.1 ATP synthase F1 subunit gamma [Gordonibacter pamelaeae]
MPNLHDIERRINSVSSTKQITRTMEMVAAAKIRRASERVYNALPWASAISEMLISTAKYAPLDSEPLLATHDEVKRALIVVIASDRGLAGGFNSNVLRHAEKLIKEKERQGIEVEIVACGKKAIGYFSYRNIVPVFEFRDLSADPTYEEAAEISQFAGDGYREGKLDEVIIVFNHAKNAAEQRLIEQQVLPINTTSYADLLGLAPKEKDYFEHFREKDLDNLPGDIDFEPDAESVMHYLMRAYLRNTFYYALIDSAAAEQGARRTAMKSATDNANEMVNTLTRVYNRVRQGAITTEISEIVGGAAALEE